MVPIDYTGLTRARIGAATPDRPIRRRASRCLAAHELQDISLGLDQRLTRGEGQDSESQRARYQTIRAASGLNVMTHNSYSGGRQSGDPAGSVAQAASERPTGADVSLVTRSRSRGGPAPLGGEPSLGKPSLGGEPSLGG